MPDAKPCSYCRKRRGHQLDHLITKAQSRRNLRAARERENPKYKVPACRECNEAKYTRLRVPVGYAFKDELETLTGDVYGWFDGTAESLREVVRR